MRLRFVTVELIKQRKRVRKAERIVQDDRVRTAVAYDRFLHEVIASPKGLATFAALGFCFDRGRGGPARGGGVLGRLGSFAPLAMWLRRLLVPARDRHPPPPIQ